MVDVTGEPDHNGGVAGTAPFLVRSGPGVWYFGSSVRLGWESVGVSTLPGPVSLIGVRKEVHGTGLYLLLTESPSLAPPK